MKRILSIAAMIMIMVLIGTVPALADDTGDGQPGAEDPAGDAAVDYGSITQSELLALIVQGQEKSKQLSAEINDLRENLADAEAGKKTAEEEYSKAIADAEAAITKAKEDAKAADDAAALALEAADAAVKAAEEAALADPDDAEAAGRLQEARNDLAEAQNNKDASADLLQRAEALSLEGAIAQEITDPDFSYLNGGVQKVKDAGVKLGEAQAAVDAIKQAIKGKENEQEKVNTQVHEMMVMYQNMFGSGTAEEETNNYGPAPVPVPVVGAGPETPAPQQAEENAGEQYVSEQDADGQYTGVATGDTNNIVLPVAGLLAAAAIFATAVILNKKRSL